MGAYEYPYSCNLIDFRVECKLGILNSLFLKKKNLFLSTTNASPSTPLPKFYDIFTFLGH